MGGQSQFIEMFGNNKWKVTNLDKLCHEWIKGQAFKKDSMSNDGCNKCIHYGELFTKYGPIINEVYSSTDSTIVKASKKGDILFPASDVTPDGLARCSAIMEDNVLLGGDIIALRPNSNISPQYLSWAINMQKEQLLQRVTGSVVRHISAKGLKTVEVVMPTMTQQKQFVAIAEQTDKSKFVGFKSQFIEMFGNPLSDVQKYELRKLGECCDLNPKRPRLSFADSDLVSFVPMPSVSEDGHLVNVADEKYRKVKKGFTYFENNDVLFAKITPCMENGKGAIAHNLTNKIGMGSTEIHVLRPIDGVSNAYWLLALTRLPIFREHASKNMSGTGGQKRVGTAFLENFMVGLPPICEQQTFETIYKQADKSKYNEYKS